MRISWKNYSGEIIGRITRENDPGKFFYRQCTGENSWKNFSGNFLRKNDLAELELGITRRNYLGDLLETITQREFLRHWNFSGETKFQESLENFLGVVGGMNFLGRWNPQEFLKKRKTTREFFREKISGISRGLTNFSLISRALESLRTFSGKYLFEEFLGNLSGTQISREFVRESRTNFSWISWGLKFLRNFSGTWISREFLGDMNFKEFLGDMGLSNNFFQGNDFLRNFSAHFWGEHFVRKFSG